MPPFPKGAASTALGVGERGICAPFFKGGSEDARSASERGISVGGSSPAGFHPQRNRKYAQVKLLRRDVDQRRFWKTAGAPIIETDSNVNFPPTIGYADELRRG